MLMVEMRSEQNRGEPIAVNGRRYYVDGEGTVAVQQDDVEALTMCGFVAIGQVELPDRVVRLPASRQEFLDVARNLKLTPQDLRDLALILEDEEVSAEAAEVEAAAEVEVQDEVEQVLEAVGESVAEEEGGPAPAEEDEGIPEVEIHPGMSREELLAIADRYDIAVPDRRKKKAIYDAIVANGG